MRRLLTPRRILVPCALLLVAGTWLLRAQTQPGGSPADQALRALHRGQFDQVDRLLAGATDPRSVALRARAAAARGRYADAEQMLRGPAAQNPGSDAALELGLLQLYLGRRREGDWTLARLLAAVDPDTAAEYLRSALAARALGMSRGDKDLLHEANELFREANRLAPDDPVINTAWGEIWLETYDPAEAARKFQDAVRVAEDYVPALVGLARVAAGENPQAAKSTIDRILKLNPNSIPAHLLAAELALDERRRDDARAAVRRALEVNPDSLEARALEAAMALVDGRDTEFEQKAQEVLRINPVYGEVYRVAGDQLARNYRFDEAEVVFRKAISVDPDSARAHADLGLNLLRTGDEASARKALERAFERDPFNQVTYNLLLMLDELDKFQTITDGDLVMRFHPDEVGVMREQALPLAKQALSTLQERYKFKVRGPILIEMFPKHDDFAVRTLGLPGMIGALGACFGRVVTLDSPRARPPGEFNWQATLWHELAHVITLQMSNNRLPRWVSEGASQWEERRARPEWGREMEVPFAQALEEGRLLKLKDLNEGFSDPRLISLTYHQASLVVEHLVETYGEPKFHELLRAYGRGLETEEAFKTVFGATIDEIQASFDARIERQYASLRRALRRPKLDGKPALDDLKRAAAEMPDSFVVQMQLAAALEQAGDLAGAIGAYERAAQLVPSATGDNNPHARIAAIAIKQGNDELAIAALEAALRVNHEDVESARLLAARLARTSDPARTEAAYRRVVELDPFDVQAQTALGRLAFARKDVQTALVAFRSALAANPPDRASAHVDLAEAYLAAGQPGEAKRHALAALEIAPAFERAQDLLLRIVDGAP
ncbi:MAG TPA: tetratricopeptide repeat protein [Vicinamibacterales bacterium]|nr:tetratricopeptide repeat protein [Vicinamibacterales bacterium]